MCKYPSPVARFVLPETIRSEQAIAGWEGRLDGFLSESNWHPDKFRFRAALQIAVALARHASHLYSPFILIPISQSSLVKPSSRVHDYMNGGVIGFSGIPKAICTNLCACLLLMAALSGPAWANFAWPSCGFGAVQSIIKCINLTGLTHKSHFQWCKVSYGTAVAFLIRKIENRSRAGHIWPAATTYTYVHNHDYKEGKRRDTSEGYTNMIIMYLFIYWNSQKCENSKTYADMHLELRITNH